MSSLAPERKRELAMVGKANELVFTWQTNVALVVLPTPGGPDSSAAFNNVPSSFQPPG